VGAALSHPIVLARYPDIQSSVVDRETLSATYTKFGQGTRKVEGEKGTIVISAAGTVLAAETFAADFPGRIDSPDFRTPLVHSGYLLIQLLSRPLFVQQDFATIALQAEAPRPLRVGAILKLSDQRMLHYLASRDRDVVARRAAIEGLTDVGKLREFLASSEYRIPAAARDRIEYLQAHPKP